MQKYFLDTLYDNGYLNGTGNNINLFLKDVTNLFANVILMSFNRLLACIVY